MIACHRPYAHMAWSSDGAWLVTGDDHGGVWLWPHGSEPGRRLASSTVAGELARATTYRLPAR